MTSPALVVFRKELLDTLRDRRTLVAMVIVPLLLFPLLTIGMARFTYARAMEESARVLRVAVVDPERTGLADHLRQEEGFEVEEVQDAPSQEERVRAEEIDVALIVASSYRQRLAAHLPAEIELLHNSGDFAIPRRRTEAALDRFERGVLAERLRPFGLKPAAIDPLVVKPRDVASESRRLAGLLPYMFIIFCFTGSMYPAIDLAAGEKERGTLETLLSSPASRLQIALGKFAVVVLGGLTSALLAALSMYASVRLGVEGVPPEMIAAVASALAPATFALVLALLVPLAVFFAAALLMLSLRARSYKEALSVISPLMIAVIVPAMIALAPGVRLGPMTAVVPILNVSLATREIIAHTAAPLDLVLVFVSLVALAALGVFACARWFEREDILFRA
ncbi:MAG TPA: ABC transporter permease subunit [Nannocystis sp.]